MTIDDQVGEGVDARFVVSFHERKIADILAIDENDRSTERDFAAVQRLSELGAEMYELGVRPLVQAMITPQVAEALRRSHPSRVQRLMFADANPLMRGVRAAAEAATRERKPADPANPFVAAEKLWAASVIHGFDLARDLRDALCEASFLTIYGSPAMKRVGATHAFERTRKDPKALRFLPEVQAILIGLDRGGFEEAVIRMLIVLADSRSSVRRDRLERSARVLTKDEPFASLGAERRAALIREQSIIVEFEREKAIETLPRLLPSEAERRKAVEVVEFIAGSIEEMEPKTLQMVQRFHAALGLPGLALPAATPNPLAENPAARENG
jgi:hypothetical protein